MKKLLIISSYFRPGYKAGGPIKSVNNLASELGEDLDVYILTRNHDLNEKKTYELPKNKWIKKDRFHVFYDDNNLSFKTYNKIKLTEFDFIYLNSLFSKSTIQFLILNRNCKNIFLSPRGELGEGALNIKKKKKKLFLAIAKLFSIYKHVHFIGSSNLEVKEIKKYFPRNKVNEISNFSDLSEYKFINKKMENKLNLFFISRITKKKNLEFLLNIMKYIDGEVNLKIIGPAEDTNYYEKCKEIVESLPRNINVKFIGSVNPSELHNLVKNDDYFILPTLNENYGHVIAEAISYKKPIIISDQTPWNEYITKNKLGHVLSLENDLWINTLKKSLELDNATYNEYNKNFEVVENSFREKNKETKKQYLRIFK